MMLTAFLSGFIVALYFVASTFFLKFWRSTKDHLFLAFALSFFLEGLNRLRFISIAHPDEAGFGFYAIRFAAFLMIATAIIWRNARKG